MLFSVAIHSPRVGSIVSPPQAHSRFSLSRSCVPACRTILKTSPRTLPEAHGPIRALHLRPVPTSRSSPFLIEVLRVRVLH